MGVPVSGNVDFTNSSSDKAQSGDIRTGTVFNISGSGSVGTVKMLAIAGIAWLFYKILTKR